VPILCHDRVVSGSPGEWLKTFASQVSIHSLGNRIVATIENRSKYVVSVKNNDALQRT
jgi:hypothetical protein